MSLFGDIIKKPLIEQVENARKGLPATLTGLSTQAVAALPLSIDKAVIVFKRTYTDVTVRLATWVPTMIPVGVRVGNKLADWAVARIKAIK